MRSNLVFERKNILIAGGAGFIGSHLCDELIKNSNIICVDNFSSGSEKNIDHLLADENFEFIKADITQPIDISSLPELKKFKIEFQGIQEIYNLACPTSPKYFMENRINMILANSAGVRNLLDMAVQFGSKFMHFSSSVVYGLRGENNAKVNEDNLGRVDILSERSSYDEGKRFAETMVKNYGDIFGIDAKIIRLFRVYGPRMKLNDDQMLPDFIGSALENMDLVIYGDENFSTSLLYISDCIDAVKRMMESGNRGPINIGSDVEVKLSDVAGKIIRMTGSRSRIRYEKEILFMNELCLPEIAKARSSLDWMPVMNLDSGLEKTIYELRASKGLKGVEHAL
jgi:UDP-glucuronate decarboxylase